MGPKERRPTVLSQDEEALIVAFRKHTLLPLDGCLYALQGHCHANSVSRQMCTVVTSINDPVFFKRHRFPPKIIRHAIWLYSRFTLSLHNVEEMLAERGVDVSYETVRRWFLKFGPAMVRTTKADAALALLRRKGGATVGQIMDATGWQAHSVRGFLSGTVRKRMGLALTSARKEGGERRYRIDDGKIDVVVACKVDRLTRSLSDFARIVETFDAHHVSFVSVTQQFNTTTSMGRLTLNVLLSFAQFEREVTAERIRDKITASKKKGMWMGGNVPLGYDAIDRKLVVNDEGAVTVRRLFDLYLRLGSVQQVCEEARRLSLRTKMRKRTYNDRQGGEPFQRGHLYKLLSNPIDVGEVSHKGER